MSPSAEQFSFTLILHPTSFYPSSIISEFGEQKKKFGNKLHVGDDVHQPAGTRVDAISSGTVRFATTWKSTLPICKDWGTIVVVEHKLPDGRFYNSIYAHLGTALMVELDDKVSAGQQIGVIGHYEENGKPCYQDHLHFAIYQGEFGQPSGQYPYWLTGYLPKELFPGRYCDPQGFIGSLSCRKP